MLLKLIGAFWLFTRVAGVFAQFSPGISYELSFPTANTDFSYTVMAFNENETFTFYEISTNLNPTASGVSIRNFGRRFDSKQKWILGYSLEIGYRKFSTNNRMAFSSSSTQNNDSIVRNYNGFQFKTDYNALYTSHYLDVHFNPTDKIKITNSFGLSLAAIISSDSRKTNVPGKGVESNYPILKVIYQPQITEDYERVSISYYANFDCFSWDLFRSSTKGFLSETNGIPLSKIRFNGVGVRIVPHFKPEKRIDPMLDF